ncbi:MAG TPA: phage terminase large subunit [Candidatus Saccharimonadales bacterium]|nr:phage terminase large subunit [Candidatus Saccharimonadales bacterium]
MDLEQANAQANLVGLDRIAERCKRDLFFLNKYILAVNPALVTERTHKDLCEITKPLLPNFDPETEHAEVHVLARELNGKKDEIMSDQFDTHRNKLLILMPRGTFKSSLVTVGFTLQYILNNPDARVLIDSETYSKSKNFLSEIKGHLEGNQKYRAIFKHIYGCYPDATKKSSSVRWTDAAVDLACRTRSMKEPSISCSGIDRSINGMHFDLIIEDDLHSEKNVTNKEQIQQVIDHRKLAQSLLDPGMPRITIGTRWDYQDAYQHVLTNQRSSYNIIIRKAIEDDGSLLFPERLTLGFLEEQKRDQGNYIYHCQYQNTPVDDDTATFKQSYMRRVDWGLVKDKPINWFMAIDPSYEGQYSDYAAFVLAGMDFQQELYVRQVYRAKMNYMDIINLMFDWYVKYKPRRIALETIATQKNIQYMLSDEQKRRGMWLPIQEIKTRQNTKEERIKSLAPYYEFGRVHHVEGSLMDDLEYELLHFPKGTHDDMIDALATVLEIATPPNSKRANRDREDYKRRIFDKPRSPVTGI